MEQFDILGGGRGPFRIPRSQMGQWFLSGRVSASDSVRKFKGLSTGSQLIVHC